MEIIRALVEAGANIQLPNHFGGTCLINCVQSPDLVEYLITNGADVNAEDVQHKTASNVSQMLLYPCQYKDPQTINNYYLFPLLVKLLQPNHIIK